jgi:hypothetical protein
MSTCLYDFPPKHPEGQIDCHKEEEDLLLFD